VSQERQAEAAGQAPEKIAPGKASKQAAGFCVDGFDSFFHGYPILFQWEFFVNERLSAAPSLNSLKGHAVMRMRR